MPNGVDPALLMFAGRFLSQGGGDPSNGFGNALGAGLEAAGGHQLFKQEQQRVKRNDLVKSAQSSIAMRKALQEIQAGEIKSQQAREQQEANRAFLNTLPPEQQAAARVNPQEAALLETKQANPDPLTADQQVDNNLAREQFNYQKKVDERNFKANQRQQDFENTLAKAKAGKPSGEDVSRIRKEYTASSKDFGQVRDSYKKILATDDSAAGDLSLVFGYMKMLDPTSVVREQEFANAQNAAGVPDRIRNQYNKVLTGQFLGDNQRTEFRSQANELYRVQYDTQMFQKQAYGEIASRGGIDPSNVVQQVFTPAPEQLRAEQFDYRLQRLGIDLSSVDETAQRYGMTHEEVVKLLEAQGG
jgi:hypothetical protein